jgi:penicillin amidase
VLVVYNMFLELQDDTGSTETMEAALHHYLPPALAEFLDVPGTEWDAPIVGGALLSAPRGPAPPPAVSSGLKRTAEVQEFELDGPVLGSNNWAVSGTHTADGHAWLANDMHLGLQLPNTWYRAQLRWSEPSHAMVIGVTLPGAPGVVVGSNGRVAWGFTISYGDGATSSAPGELTRHEEMIAVKGAAAVRYEVRETAWGPVVGEDPDGRPRALRWTAHDVEAVNLNLFRLATAHDLEDALHLAALSGIPAQNFVAVDDAGHIGWTICGRIPDRQSAGNWTAYLPPTLSALPIRPPAASGPPTTGWWTARCWPSSATEVRAGGASQADPR